MSVDGWALSSLTRDAVKTCLGGVRFAHNLPTTCRRQPVTAVITSNEYAQFKRLSLA